MAVRHFKGETMGKTPDWPSSELGGVLRNLIWASECRSAFLYRPSLGTTITAFKAN